MSARSQRGVTVASAAARTKTAWKPSLSLRQVEPELVANVTPRMLPHMFAWKPPNNNARGPTCEHVRMCAGQPCDYGFATSIGKSRSRPTETPYRNLYYLTYLASINICFDFAFDDSDDRPAERSVARLVKCVKARGRPAFPTNGPTRTPPRGSHRLFSAAVAAASSHRTDETEE
ncbi:unnamed protein product, partial [Iphiclides podalirius]